MKNKIPVPTDNYDTRDPSEEMDSPFFLLRATNGLFGYAIYDLTGAIEPTVKKRISKEIKEELKRYIERLEKVQQDADNLCSAIEDGDYYEARPLYSSLRKVRDNFSQLYEPVASMLRSMGKDTHTPELQRLQNASQNCFSEFLCEARKFINLDAIRNDIKETKSAAERAANNTDTIIDELAMWREWVRQLATTQKNTTPVPKLYAPIQKAIVDLWQSFNAQPADCEDTTEPSGWRKHRRTYNECLAIHGNDDIWHGRKLIDLTPSAKDLERVIHNAKEKKRKKPAAASAPQTRRKK